MGGQSRGGRACEEPLSPNVLFPASYLWREDKELDKYKLEGIRVIRETGGPIVKISAVSRIWGIISTLAAYSRGALHTERA